MMQKLYLSVQPIILTQTRRVGIRAAEITIRGTLWICAAASRSVIMAEMLASLSKMVLRARNKSPMAELMVVSRPEVARSLVVLSPLAMPHRAVTAW